MPKFNELESAKLRVNAAIELKRTDWQRSITYWLLRLLGPFYPPQIFSMALEVDDRKGTTSHFSTPKWTIDIDDDHDGHNLRSSSHYIGTHRLTKLSFAAVLSSRRLLCWQQSRQLCPFFSFLAISLSTSRRPCVDATWSPWLVIRLRSPMKKVSFSLGCRGFNRLVKSRPETKKRRECSQSGGGGDLQHPTINLDATNFLFMTIVRNQRKKIRVY